MLFANCRQLYRVPRDNALIASGGLLDGISNHALLMRYLRRRWTVGGISSSSHVDINYMDGVCQVEVEAKV